VLNLAPALAAAWLAITLLDLGLPCPITLQAAAAAKGNRQNGATAAAAAAAAAKGEQNKRMHYLIKHVIGCISPATACCGDLAASRRHVTEPGTPCMQKQRQAANIADIVKLNTPCR
jgi:hypothetical protein